MRERRKTASRGMSAEPNISGGGGGKLKKREEGSRRGARNARGEGGAMQERGDGR